MTAMSIVNRTAATVVLCLISGVASAIYYPSIQISGAPGANICTATPFTLPINANTSPSTSNSSSMTVAGVGVVSTFSQTNPAFNGPTVYSFSPSAYTVAPGTLVTINIRTYNSVNQSGGQSWDSTIVFACDTGAITSLVNAGLPVPTLSEWSVALLALLVALAASTVFVRRRRNNS
jgi:hypothetical protein